jgi:hypothetical protein
MEITRPKIIDCTMGSCAYNMNSMCHAMSINVGGSQPWCDTYIKSKEKGGVHDIIGDVGACKVKDCSHNENLECKANGVHIGKHTKHAFCMTFSKIES